jgi:alpha-ketoglutarate-dependent taurine dioxygenase
MKQGFQRTTKAPQKVRVLAEDMVSSEFFESARGFPLVLKPILPDLDLCAWVSNNKQYLTKALLEHGAILFRNFQMDSVEEFRLFAQTALGDLLKYEERAAPRQEVSDKIFTSTEYPADQVIPMHHEMSYSHNWPLRILFFCLVPSAEGGCTPIADDRKVIHLIPARIKERFVEKNVMYVRNFGEGADMEWQEAFQTKERSVVEQYCRAANMKFEWKNGDRLKTWQVRPAIVRHPVTGEEVWFNHAHMFHISNMEAKVREALLAEFREDELPRNAFYGDGTPIESEVVEEIRRIYSDSAFRFRWQKGDIMMLDNILASHGRDPFQGERRIMVAMSQLYCDAEPTHSEI